MPDGRVADIEIERFENARGIYSGGVLQDSHDRLRFETEDRHEVMSGGVTFIAVETPSPVKQPLGGTWRVSIMVIGDRLKTLREAKNLSQGDIEKRTGLLRCYGDKPPALPKSAKLSTKDSLESSRSGALLMKKLVYVPKS